MNKWVTGFIAGFVATAILSALLILKTQLEIVPEFNVIRDFSLFFNTEQIIVGWVTHFILGTFVWGGLFVLMLPILVGAYWLKGILFGLIAWVFMMIGFMPVMEHGLFAEKLGMPVMFATLVLHIVYGAIVGICYGIFTPKNKNAEL